VEELEGVAESPRCQPAAASAPTTQSSSLTSTTPVSTFMSSAATLDTFAVLDALVERKLESLSPTQVAGTVPPVNLVSTPMSPAATMDTFAVLDALVERRLENLSPTQGAGSARLVALSPRTPFAPDPLLTSRTSLGRSYSTFSESDLRMQPGTPTGKMQSRSPSTCRLEGGTSTSVSSENRYQQLRGQLFGLQPVPSASPQMRISSCTPSSLPRSMFPSAAPQMYLSSCTPLPSPRNTSSSSQLLARSLSLQFIQSPVGRGYSRSTTVPSTSASVVMDPSPSGGFSTGECSSKKTLASSNLLTQSLVRQTRVLPSYGAICPCQESDGQLDREMTGVEASDSEDQEQLIEHRLQKFQAECRQERYDVCLPFSCFGLEAMGTA